MTTRVGTLLIVAAVLATVLPARSQQPAPKAKLDPVVAETQEEYELGMQKARLELKILEAEVEAKKAEIKRAEAEHRVRRLAPTLAILSKLERRIAVHFPRDTPLEEVLKAIKSATAGPGDAGLPIYVDPVGLQEAEKSLQSPVSLDIEGIPAKTVLRLILKQVGLTYTVKDGLVTITSAEADDGPPGEAEASP